LSLFLLLHIPASSDRNGRPRKTAQAIALAMLYTNSQPRSTLKAISATLSVLATLSRDAT
jgi:hypothetical protein